MKRQLLLLFVIAFFGAGVAVGQIGRGTILGTVTDATGAVVANATVEISNVGTNMTQKTQTTSAGTYNVPYLPP